MEYSRRPDGLFGGFQKKVKAYANGKSLFTCELNFANKYEKRETLILVHGSGGISLEIELWRRLALDQGWNVVITDHFTSRGIDKLMLDGTDVSFCTPLDIAQDLGFLLEDLYKVSNSGITIVGFSLGAAAAMLANDEKIKFVKAFYPPLRPIPQSMLSKRLDNLEIVVGDQDILTPVNDVYSLAELVGKSLNVKCLPGVHHSFMKPGIDIDSRVCPIGLNLRIKNRVCSDEEYQKIFFNDEFFSVERPWTRVRLKGEWAIIKEQLKSFFKIECLEKYTDEFNK